MQINYISNLILKKNQNPLSRVLFAWENNNIISLFNQHQISFQKIYYLNLINKLGLFQQKMTIVYIHTKLNIKVKM